jgi:coproporphyrinogen III oxidase-like Fe-S oxidoreductase
VALSTQPNYTDWATATCQQNLVPTFVDRGVSLGQHGGSPVVINLKFSRPEPLLFFHVVSNLLSFTYIYFSLSLIIKNSYLVYIKNPFVSNLICYCEFTKYLFYNNHFGSDNINALP